MLSASQIIRYLYLTDASALLIWQIGYILIPTYTYSERTLVLIASLSHQPECQYEERAQTDIEQRTFPASQRQKIQI